MICLLLQVQDRSDTMIRKQVYHFPQRIFKLFTRGNPQGTPQEFSHLSVLSNIPHTTSFLSCYISVDNILEHGVTYFITYYQPLVGGYIDMLSPQDSIHVIPAKKSRPSNLFPGLLRSSPSNVYTVSSQIITFNQNDTKLKVLITPVIYKNRIYFRLEKQLTFKVMIMDSMNCSKQFMLPVRDKLRGPLLD